MTTETTMPQELSLSMRRCEKCGKTTMGSIRVRGGVQVGSERPTACKHCGEAFE